MRRSHRKALLDFERSLRTGHPRTRELHVGLARRFLANLDKPLNRAYRGDVELHLAALAALGFAPSSGARALSSLRVFFRFVERSEVTEGLKVKIPRKARLQLSQVAVQKLLRAALHVGHESGWWPLALRNRALIELLYACALRRAEVQAVRLVDLDLGAGTLMVRRVKRTQPGVVPITPSALAWVRRYLEEGRPRLLRGGDHGLLFVTRRGAPLHIADVNAVLKVVGKRAGVKASPHAIRRACATHMVEAGVSVRAVQVLLGHGSLEHTAGYVGVSREALRWVVGVLERPKGI